MPDRRTRSRLHRDQATAQLWHEQPGALRAYLTVTAVTAGVGLMLVLGDPRRTSGPAYATINESGGPRWVGVAFLVLAAALVVAPLLRPLVVRVALLLACAMHLTVGGSFLASAVRDVHVGGLAPIYIGALAGWLISQAELYRALRAAGR